MSNIPAQSYASLDDPYIWRAEDFMPISVYGKISAKNRKTQKIMYGLTVLLVSAVCIIYFQSGFYEKSVEKKILDSYSSMQSLYSLDACASSKSKTQCCTDTNYPVLGGLDVVALGQLHKGNPPVLGNLDFPAAVITKAGKYVFLFSSKENQQKFIQDPWRYAPKWGGFDASEIALNNALKGDVGKALLGMNTNVGEWLSAKEGRVLMFGSATGKSNYLVDASRLEPRGDDKWIGWWGDLKEGPFNTQCLTGLTFSELEAATEKYNTGELRYGPATVQELYLETTPRKQLKNAISTARIFTVNPDGKMDTLLVEEGTGKGFGLTPSFHTLAPLSTAVLAIDSNIHPGSLFVADAKTGQIVRFCTHTLKSTVVLPHLEGKVPVAMVWSVLDERLYYATSTAIHWVDRTGSSQGTFFEAPEEVEIQDIAVDASHLYYVDKTTNQLKFTSLSGSDASASNWEELTSPADAIASLFPWIDGHMFIVTEANSVYLSILSEKALTELSSSSSASKILSFFRRLFEKLDLIQPSPKESTPTDSPFSAPTEVLTISNNINKLFDWPEPILSLQVEGSTLYMAVPNRIMSAELLSDSLGFLEFKEVVTEMEQVQRGMVIKNWASPNGLTFSASTKYTERGDAPIFNDYPWAAGLIVEPHLPTSLRVSQVSDSPDISYRWSFQGQTTSGLEYQLLLEKTGTYPIILQEIDSEGTVLRELRTVLVCKYIRREIRTLTDEDREAFFKGLERMVSVSDTEGARLYGKNFKNNEYFIGLHNELVGAQDCDHLQSGRGFLTNHMSLTLQFEQSLQMIDPALTVPYWDYTIDRAEIQKNFGGDLSMLWSASPIFSPDWFGDAHNDEFTITEGRWAHKLKIPTEQWKSQHHNSYGLMRAPWNNNPNHYVQRFDTFSNASLFNYNNGWPTCEDHLLQSTASPTFMDYSLKVQNVPYGTVHGVLGGTVNMENSLDRLKGVLEDKDLALLRVRTLHLTKEMYRKGFVVCPEYCAPTTPKEQCKCVCPQKDIDKIAADKELFNLYATATLGGAITNAYDDEALQKGIQVICDSGFLIGDQEESSAPADPLFWVIYPTVERLYKWKLLNGGFQDSTWPDEKGNYNAQIYIGSSQTCSGHNPADVLPWAIALDGQTAPTTYSNSDLLSFLDVTGEYQLPYLYDKFEWTHCSDQGYNFNEIQGN